MDAFFEHVETLSNYLVQCYRHPDQATTVTIAVPAISFPVDTAIPRGLIINELVSNAMKYAFPPPRATPGQIHVALRCDDDQQCELSVRDNGVGLPEIEFALRA